MKPTQWDVARTARTMGVVASVTLDPTRITVRVKNKLIRWLEAGMLDGGYQSQARKIGMMLVEKYRLPLAVYGWRGLRVCNPSETLAARLSELLEADWIAACLEAPDMAQSSYYKNKYLHIKRALENPSAFDEHLMFHSKEFSMQAKQAVGQSMTERERSLIQPAIDFLRGTEPIHCFNYGD